MRPAVGRKGRGGIGSEPCVVVAEGTLAYGARAAPTRAWLRCGRDLPAGDGRRRRGPERLALHDDVVDEDAAAVAGANVAADAAAVLRVLPAQLHRRAGHAGQAQP